jgi:isoleucyl-tRNA synthetase
LRNTFRYLLGSLDGFSSRERLRHDEMPELERWVLHRLSELDEAMRRATDEFLFQPVFAELHTFCAVDLSALYFDVRKDSLYCDAADSPKRRAYRTVLATLFDALNAWLAPVLVFTAEEAHEHRWGAAAPSVHHGTYLDIPAAWRDPALDARFDRLRELRALVTQAIEPMRRDKVVGSSNEVAVRLFVPAADLDLLAAVDFAELCIVSSATAEAAEGEPRVEAVPATHARCARCWRHLPDVAPATALCARCTDAVAAHEKAA